LTRVLTETFHRYREREYENKWANWGFGLRDTKRGYKKNENGQTRDTRDTRDTKNGQRRVQDFKYPYGVQSLTRVLTEMSHGHREKGYQTKGQTRVEGSGM